MRVGSTIFDDTLHLLLKINHFYSKYYN